MADMTAARREKRPRDAAATKAAILESARAAFIRHGYDGVGLREIAEGAGVTAMLVNRYFGSKEELFEKVAERVLSAPGLLTAPGPARGDAALTALARDTAVALTARSSSRSGAMDGFQLLLRSAANEQAMAILREKFTTYIAAPLAARLRGRDAPARAGLFLALIAGVEAMRQMPALAAADPYDLADTLRELFEQIALGD